MTAVTPSRGAFFTDDRLPQLAELGLLPHGYIRPEDGYSSGVVDGEDSGSGLIRRRPWELVASTIRWELFGLAACGVVALVSWPFGWLPDSTLFLTTSAMFAAGPVSELYRTRPPRRLAGVAALVATMTVTMLFGAAADSAFPPLADHDLGLLAGLLVGAPAGAGAVAWFSNRNVA